MNKLLKVREVITLREWIKGSGWGYSEVYSDQVIDITEDDLKSVDWDWWEIDRDNPPTVDEDTKITVDLYAVDANIYEDEPLTSHTIWASEIWAERIKSEEEIKQVYIPACANHEGIYGMYVKLRWVCPICGQPRGQILKGWSYDGSRFLAVDTWNNPCGHIDKYDDVRKEAAANGLNIVIAIRTTH